MNEKAYRVIDAFFKSVEEGMRMLEAEPSLLTERTGLGETVLHYLAVENHIAAIKVLAEEKAAELNTVNDFGATPLSDASALGHLELVKYLLSKGSRLNLPDQKEPVLHAAVRSNNLELVKVILQAGAAVNEVDDLDETALHLAAEDDDRAEIVRLLIDAGADINARRIFDETPLEVATRNGSRKITSILTTEGGI